jgi:hypothetical protein
MVHRFTHDRETDHDTIGFVGSRHWHENPLLWYSAAVLVGVILSLLIYSKVLLQPFVQDDWTVLYKIKTTSVSDLIGETFSPAGKIMYRPLGMMYFLLIFKAFGLHPLAFHLLAFAFHVANSLFATLIIEQITGRRILSVCVGLLYAVATTVHSDPLLWMVGFYDLGAVFFFFAAVLLYFRHHAILSAVAFLVSILIKDATAPLLMVLVLHAFLLDRQRLRLLWLHGIGLAVYIILRFLSVDFLGLDASHPYYVEPTEMTIVSNTALFSEWAFEVIFPYWRAKAWMVGALVALALALWAFVTVLRNHAPHRMRVRQSIFFALWTALGVSSVLLLKHHLFRYYAVYSLVPFLTLFLFYAETMVPRYLSRYTGVALTFFIVSNVIGNWLSLSDKFRHEPTSVAMFDGTNHLIRKASIVYIAQTQMLLHYPSLPTNSQLVFSGIEVAPFGKQYGPRLWYNDTSITVYTPAEHGSVNALGATGVRQTLFLTFVGDTLMR